MSRRMMGAQPHFFAPRERWGWALALRQLTDDEVLEGARQHGGEFWWTLRIRTPENVPGCDITRQLTVVARERGLMDDDEANEINQVTPRGPR